MSNHTPEDRARRILQNVPGADAAARALDGQQQTRTYTMLTIKQPDGSEIQKVWEVAVYEMLDNIAATLTRIEQLLVNYTTPR